MAKPFPQLREGQAPDGPFDVAIVGAGAVGCAVARELTRHGARCVLVEAGPDVGAGTSKANTAILHSGFDAKPGTIESRLVARGYELLSAYASEVGIPTAGLGALMVAWTPEQREALPGIQAAAAENGYEEARTVDLEELYAREPNLGTGAEGAIEIPGEGIVCPFTTTLAFATEALGGGCQLVLNAAVTGVRAVGGGHELDTDRGRIRAEYLVNAAGLRSDEIDAMLGHTDFRVTPRRGELIVFDKLARGLVNHILLPVPTEKTKGVLVSPTIYGNVLLGPTADDIEDKTDRSTTGSGLAGLMEAGERIIPRLVRQEVTATYVGLRAATEHRDYQLEGTSRTEIRLRGRDQINRDQQFPRDRRVGARRSCRCRPRAVGAGSPGGLPDAEHRRVRHAPVSGRRADRDAIPTTGESSVSASGSRAARSTRHWTARSLRWMPMDCAAVLAP